MPRRQVVVEHDALNFLFFTESLQFLRLALSDQGGRVLLSDRTISEETTSLPMVEIRLSSSSSGPGPAIDRRPGI
jgi:hypothetical protein